MAKIRTRRSATEAPVSPKKGPGKGGPRAGAGRPPTGRDTGIFMRCSHAQREAIKAFVAKLNEDRTAKGLKKIEMSTWIREIALKHSGNSHLGAAAKARAEAEALEI